MKGKHKVIVSTKRLKYEFELRRNLTIIQGDSATGKTTLVYVIKNVMCLKEVYGKSSCQAYQTVLYLLMREMNS